MMAQTPRTTVLRNDFPGLSADFLRSLCCTILPRVLSKRESIDDFSRYLILCFAGEWFRSCECPGVHENEIYKLLK